ncbi:hypothetical protein HY947_06890 [Candidatus Gottesmanbacteria bacterium]|nr:hypothetical protein [Candidatus Gottesmanbacteria bacterium]
MGNPEDEVTASLVLYEFDERAQLFIDSLIASIPTLKTDHDLETVDFWDESEVRTTGLGKRAAFLRGLMLYDDALVAQRGSDREDRESAHRELVGVACYGKVELKISDALDVIQQMAKDTEGYPFGQDVWQDFDHGDMVGIRYFVFNG